MIVYNFLFIQLVELGKIPNNVEKCSIAVLSNEDCH